MLKVLWATLSLSFFCGAVASLIAQNLLPVDPFGPLKLESVSVHGTIDVIVVTRGGVVLATDARGSRDDGSYRDDQQKLFIVGHHSACVIAGLVGVDFGVEGFHLTDSLSSHIAAIGSPPDTEAAAQNVARVARAAADGLDSVSGLMLPRPMRPIIDGEVSIVSVDGVGNFEWISFAIPIDTKWEGGEAFLQPATPIYFLHSTNLGLRFEIQALGQPQVVNGLLGAADVCDRICGVQPGESQWCVGENFTHSAIMREYYRRKQAGTLDGFTLTQGIVLAKTLVEATLRTAHPSWGVGGPVDIATLTKAEARWIVRKHEQPIPPPFRNSAKLLTLMNGIEPLDGLQCLLCTFHNMKLFYDGTGRVELVRPRFEGDCELTLGPRARELRPDDVTYLERLVSGHCQVK